MSEFHEDMRRVGSYPSKQIEEHLTANHTFGGSPKDVGMVEHGVKNAADPLGNWVLQRGYLIADIENGFIVVDLAHVRGVRMKQSNIALTEHDWMLQVTYDDGSVHTTGNLSGPSACRLCDLIRANVVVNSIPEPKCEKRV